jgi:hypothetical protein
MPSQVFISLSERVQQQVLKGTEHEGKTELDLDVFYETLAKKQKEREERRIKEDGTKEGNTSASGKEGSQDDSTKQIVSTGLKSDSSDSGQKNTLRKRKGGAESSKSKETKDAEIKGKQEGKEEKDAGSDSDIDMVTIMKGEGNHHNVIQIIIRKK